MDDGMDGIHGWNGDTGEGHENDNKSIIRSDDPSRFQFLDLSFCKMFVKT